MEWRKFVFLWPTIRPLWFRNAYRDATESWTNWAVHPENMRVQVAVNTPAQRAELPGYDVIVIGEQRPGAAYASYCLTKAVQAEPNDVIVLASDDMKPPRQWDKWICEQFEGFDGCLLINDGYQTEPSVTLPIMTFSCLLKLNRIIYHPAYFHMYSDTELYDVCAGFGVLKNLRLPGQPLFEHIHWAAKKRPPDAWDERTNALANVDRGTYFKRRALPLAERLKV
jgi:hypothetical protein